MSKLLLLCLLCLSAWGSQQPGAKARQPYGTRAAGSSQRPIVPLDFLK
ncbi:MAG: hypothetical protein MUF62_06455 [Chitinophagaceae bacterium]|jgi:hypothetical protein|nr:hypothetical protein [Chitinophagaceae bacterium]